MNHENVSRKGGNATKKKYGREYYIKLAELSWEARRSGKAKQRVKK